MLPNHRFGSARNGCSLKKHTANSISERSHTPPFDLAHFRVELTLHFILKVQDFFEVAPADIRGQSCNLLMVWPSLGKTNHVKQVLTAESWAVAGGQLSRQCRDNLFAKHHDECVLRCANKEAQVQHSQPGQRGFGPRL